MSSLKDQAARIIGRSERITATFEEIADRDRQLEATLVASDASIAVLQGETQQLREQIARLDADNAALRTQLRTVVDDLGDRIGAMSMQLDQRSIQP